jgi:predicted TIM-barrel fold metal-dependent hydrolase
MTRRNFVTTASATLANAAPPSIPIIDTHIHLFDPTRPQGVPWPPKNNPILYKPALPPRYRDVTKGLGVVGAIEVEASPWPDDNQWVLDVAAKDTIMVGTVGNLEPGKADFRADLDRLHKNPLFLGIRYGNLWGRDLGAELAKPEFIAGLKALSSAGLMLDSANPSMKLLRELVTLTDRVPDLRVVIDHLPGLATPAADPERAEYRTLLGEFKKRRQVYVKISAVLRRGADRREKLDELFETFGADRVVYGSDWPNSDPLGSYGEVLAAVREYFLAKGKDVAEKYFWKNSRAAYRWVKRAPDQPS